MDGGCHHSAEGIVVTDDDLTGGNGVVFIDDGQGVELQQTEEGVFEVLLPLLVGNILRRHKDLGHRVIVGGEEAVIGVHELTLSHGGGSLLGRDVGRSSAKRELAYAHADSARGHQHHLMACIFQITQHTAQQLHTAHVHQTRAVSQCGSANLNDDSHRNSDLSNKTYFIKYTRLSDKCPLKTFPLFTAELRSDPQTTPPRCCAAP